METRRNTIISVAIPFLLVILGAASRLLPHEANFAPIAAIALFGAVYLKPRYALAVPFAALVLSDIVLGFDSIESRLSVYGAFLLVGGIGLLIRRHKSVAGVVGGTIAGSVLFYLITNFVYFYPPVMYPHTLSGMLSSYYHALPFFRATLMGDLFYSGVLFGGYEAAKYLVRRRQSPISVPR